MRLKGEGEDEVEGEGTVRNHMLDRVVPIPWHMTSQHAGVVCGPREIQCGHVESVRLVNHHVTSRRVAKQKHLRGFLARTMFTPTMFSRGRVIQLIVVININYNI